MVLHLCIETDELETAFLIAVRVSEWVSDLVSECVPRWVAQWVSEWVSEWVNEYMRVVLWRMDAGGICPIDVKSETQKSYTEQKRFVVPYQWKHIVTNVNLPSLESPSM